MNAIWQSFSDEFKPDVEEVERCSKEVKEELKLAKSQIDYNEQKLQQMARSEQKWMKRKLKSFYSETTAKLETIQELQAYQDLRRASEYYQSPLSM